MKSANRNWTRFYIELLSQSIEVLKMWPRHTQHPVSEIAIVYMVSMLFPWHFRWNALECHGIPWDTEDCHSFYGFYAISMAFQRNSMASRWNAVECHVIPWDTDDCHSLYGLYAISMAFQWNYMASRWNSMGYRR